MIRLLKLNVMCWGLSSHHSLEGLLELRRARAFLQALESSSQISPFRSMLGPFKVPKTQVKRLRRGTKFHGGTVPVV